MLSVFTNRHLDRQDSSRSALPPEARLVTDDVEVAYRSKLFLRARGWSLVARSPYTRRHGLLRQFCWSLSKIWHRCERNERDGQPTGRTVRRLSRVQSRFIRQSVGV